MSCKDSIERLRSPRVSTEDRRQIRSLTASTSARSCWNRRNSPILRSALRRSAESARVSLTVLSRSLQERRAGMVVVAGLIGFAVATEQGLDDTAAEVVELGDFHHELGPEVLQGRREIGHGACLLRRTYLLSGKRDLVFCPAPPSSTSGAAGRTLAVFERRSDACSARLERRWGIRPYVGAARQRKGLGEKEMTATVEECAGVLLRLPDTGLERQPHGEVERASVVESVSDLSEIGAGEIVFWVGELRRIEEIDRLGPQG